jgi:hypothetical protein
MALPGDEQHDKAEMSVGNSPSFTSFVSPGSSQEERKTLDLDPDDSSLLPESPEPVNNEAMIGQLKDRLFTSKTLVEVKPGRLKSSSGRMRKGSR